MSQQAANHVQAGSAPSVMARYLQIPFSIRTKSTSDFQVSCSSDRIQWRNSAFHHNAWISSIHGHIAIADLTFNAETFFSISRSQFMKKKTHEMKLLNVLTVRSAHPMMSYFLIHK